MKQTEMSDSEYKSPKELVDGFFSKDDLDKARMSPDEVADFIKGAERFEETDPVTGYAAICYRKDDRVLVYDVVTPEAR